MRVMEEPGGRFAHGFFRRTGDAGSVTARGGDRKVSGGLDPIPSQRHTAWASRHTHLRTARARDRACSHTATPRERAPRQEQILRKGIAEVGIVVKNKVRTQRCRRSSSPVPLDVMAGLVPAIPMQSSAAPRTIGITGTRPVMT